MFSRNCLIGVLALMCAATGVAHGAHAASNCSELYREIEATGAEADTQTVKAFLKRAEKLPDCDEAFRSALGRRVAVAILKDVDAALASGASAAAHKAEIEESLQFHPMWMAYAMLGDIAREGRDYETATQRYQQALQVIDDPDFTKVSPGDAMIAKIVRKAETARMLAGRYVAAPRTRGKPTGLGALTVRGFKIEKVAIPVTFQFGTTNFTKEGAAAAQDLLSQLTAQGKPDVTLVGHTDPVGSHASNQLLSEKRALAVARFLKQEGYDGNIITKGLGETRQFVPDDPKRYSKDELHQMSRRVELVR